MLDVQIQVSIGNSVYHVMCKNETNITESSSWFKIYFKTYVFFYFVLQNKLHPINAKLSTKQSFRSRYLAAILIV